MSESNRLFPAGVPYFIWCHLSVQWCRSVHAIDYGLYISQSLLNSCNWSGDWNLMNPGFTSVGHPSSLEIARTHGVYVPEDMEGTREKYLRGEWGWVYWSVLVALLPSFAPSLFRHLQPHRDGNSKAVPPQVGSWQAERERSHHSWHRWGTSAKYNVVTIPPTVNHSLVPTFPSCLGVCGPCLLYGLWHS